MNSAVLVLEPLGMVDEAGWSTLRWKLHNDAAKGYVLEHSVPTENAQMLVAPKRGDSALCAVLLWAMHRNLALRIEGEVSPRLLDGLDNLQQIWQRWHPNRYRRVDIQAARELEVSPVQAGRPAVFALSGGVDASFSLFRHLQGQAGRNNRAVGAALLVHGLDIPLARQDFYHGAVQRATQLLAGTGVPLLTMRTNARQLGHNWEDVFGLTLFACLLTLQRNFASAVFGSGNPYNIPLTAWGSTPLTDPLCSTAAMQIEHDGCAFDRTEKCEWLGRNTDITALLRVCWAGESLDRNCGKCEKCLRTMLNFWAVALPVPAAFSNNLTPALIKSIRPKNELQFLELQSLLRHAAQHHAPSDPLLGAVQQVIRRAKLTIFTSRVSGYLRRRLRL